MANPLQFLLRRSFPFAIINRFHLKFKKIAREQNWIYCFAKQLAKVILLVAIHSQRRVREKQKRQFIATHCFVSREKKNATRWRIIDSLGWCLSQLLCFSASLSLFLPFQSRPRRALCGAAKNLLTRRMPSKSRFPSLFAVLIDSGVAWKLRDFMHELGNELREVLWRRLLLALIARSERA